MKTLSQRIADKERDITLYRGARPPTPKVERELQAALDYIAKAKEENLSPDRSNEAEAALAEAARHYDAARVSWGL